MEPATSAPAARHPWRRRLLVLGALAVVVATALVADRTLRTESALRAAEIRAFDLDQAMDLAGTAVPPETQSFYFFVLEPNATGESGELADKLVQAAGEREFLGITGADAVHNREVLLAALAIIRERKLDGLILIYLGPPQHEAELQPLVVATGAQFHFIAYLPQVADAI